MAGRNKKRALVAGVAALGVAAVAVAGLALTRPADQPPVSEKVAQYYSNPPSARQSGVINRSETGPLKVVFAGDSLTYGLFASSEDKGYRPQVVAALSASGPVEASRGGQTGNKIKEVADSITFPADTNLVVLALGTNDVWKTDTADVAVHYKALVEKVVSSAPDATLICLGVWANQDGARNYDPHIQRPCEDAGGRFLRLTDLYDTPENHGPAGKPAFGGISDEFHPNDAGYKAIADRLLSAVTVK